MFAGCTSLKSITMPGSVTSIGAFSFENCTSLKNIVIPDSVTNIDDGAFNGCISLGSITIPNSVTNIGKYVFINCTGLTNITIPDSVTNIGIGAFDLTPWLAKQSDDFVLAGKVLYKYNGNQTDVKLPDTVISIGDWAFRDCKNIRSITVPDGVTSIGTFAFSCCTSLESINIPDGMKLSEADSFTTVHNYIDTEHMILRKGAVSAYADERLLIPINMRDGSLICTGLGNEDWNFSAPHGAGRLMNRAEAKQSFTVSAFKKAMDGIYTSCVCEDTLDECPMVYKPMDEIVGQITDTVKIESVIRPIYNFKASEFSGRRKGR